MSKKQKDDRERQLSLFPESVEEDEIGFDDEDFGLNFEPSDRTLETEPAELLTLTLLKQAIQAQNPKDAVMQDFAEYVLPNLLRVATGVTAKGGKFFDNIDRKREAAGEAKVRRDNAADQSLNTHLLNGLFPANLIEQRLEKLDTTIKRVVGERERRIAIAGFILHDFEKFNYDSFPQLPEQFKAIRREEDGGEKIRQLSIEEHQEIFQVFVSDLGLDLFFNPTDSTAYKPYIDDLLCVAYNAQIRYGTNWNFSDFGLNPTLKDRTLRQLADLTRLADLLASVIKHPQDAEHLSLNETLHQLSDGQLKFTYHSIAENRGVLTNVVNNALMEAHTAVNTDDCTYYESLLYLPTGVIYLARRDAPPISIDGVPDRVVSNIRTLCRHRLLDTQTGFGRDGKGLKYAEYYDRFFDDAGLMEVALKATLRILNPNKTSVAKSRSQNLVKFQQQGVLSPDYDFSFDDDIRIDRLAEFCDVASRKIWGGKVHRIEQAIKQDKTLPPLPYVDLVREAAQFWQLEEYLPQLLEIQKINETLKDLKLKGNTGGVPYECYYLAAKYLECHPGLEIDAIRDIGKTLIRHLATLIQPISQNYTLADGWDDLRDWVKWVVMLPGNTTAKPDAADVFLQELDRYQLAKKPGRGRQLICSISHSPYTVSEQMESAVLFTPQVYTNKQMLGGSNAKRNISSIAGVEMMLRQILMNQTQAIGKKFEEGKYRYLYFYPTYYFTPETNKFLHRAYSNIAQTRFTTELRNHFVNRELEADFRKDRYQSVDSFLIDETLQARKQLPEDDPNRAIERAFKLSYPDDRPLTFYFMALPPEKPPGKDSEKKITDTASWVMPAWLALAFPIILDVKTVVSESPIPPFNDGGEFEETVFFDSAPQAFRVLTQRDRFRLDYILEGWQEENGTSYPSPLKALTAAYAIHLDVNAKQSKGKYDANWGKLTELAKNFETSPLSVFSYLNRWIRRQGVDTARIEKIRLYAYSFYPCFDPYVKYEQEKFIVAVQSPLNHPKKLTELYRKFYRANKRYNPKSNAVLKPIDIASETILKAESSVFQGETLVAAVAAEVFKLMDRVHASTAEGRWVFSNREKERQAVLEFALYFVEEVFEKAFKGDRARLAGRQINLIRNTCEFLYRLAQDEENRQSPEPDESENDV